MDIDIYRLQVIVFKLIEPRPRLTVCNTAGEDVCRTNEKFPVLFQRALLYILIFHSALPLKVLSFF